MLERDLKKKMVCHFQAVREIYGLLFILYASFCGEMIGRPVLPAPIEFLVCLEKIMRDYEYSMAILSLDDLIFCLSADTMFYSINTGRKL